MSTGAAEIRALLVTLDLAMVTTFTQVLNGFHIGAQRSADSLGIPAELGSAKYEALILDFDTIAATSPILASVRGSPSNRHALIFAVATGSVRKKNALEQGANFIFERPFAVGEINQVMRRAYDLMLGERKRYFRCAAELRLLIASCCGPEIPGVTINISSTGLALRTNSSFNLAQELQITFCVPDSELGICVKGVVVWDDKHGKTGIQFQCKSSEMQHALNSWLEAKFCEVLGIQTRIPD